MGTDRLKTALVASIAAICLAGCGGPVGNPADIQAWAKPYEVHVTAKDYVIQPPDEIEIRCELAPEVHLQRQRVRPDGKVSFERIGEVEIAGLAPTQAAAVIKEKLRPFYELTGQYPVDVRVAAFTSKVYYVLGEVSRPGPAIYSGRDSVMTALSANYPTITAWEQKTRVIRPSSDAAVPAKIFKVNYAKMRARGETSMDVLLEEGDVIYVPPTILARVAMVLEEAIRPIARAFYGAYLVQNPPLETERGYLPTSGGSRF